MKNKFINGLTNFIAKHKECSDRDIKIIKYGLEGVYNNITKIFFALVIVLIFNCTIEFLCLLFFYFLIRKYSFGIHANSSLVCWLTTIPIYCGGSLIIKYFNINIYILFIIWLLSFISFVLWAPADTPKRPLIHEKTRKKQKIKTCVICVLYFFIIIFLNINILNDAIGIAIFVQSIVINPITYKLTNTPFNNYKLNFKSV